MGVRVALGGGASGRGKEGRIGGEHKGVGIFFVCSYSCLS